MEQTITDDIDLVMRFGAHGWSTCYIYVEGRQYAMAITHIFGDPYYPLIQALIDLINGQKTVSFLWHDEPGGEKIDITRIKSNPDYVLVHIQSFSESFGSRITDTEDTLKVTVSLQRLLILFYFQLKKIQTLLRDKHFTVDRNNVFAFKEFIELEKHMKRILKL